jgi:hypothetical protein
VLPSYLYSAFLTTPGGDVGVNPLRRRTIFEVKEGRTFQMTPESVIPCAVCLTLAEQLTASECERREALASSLTYRELLSLQQEALAKETEKVKRLTEVIRIFREREASR